MSPMFSSSGCFNNEMILGALAVFSDVFFESSQWYRGGTFENTSRSNIGCYVKG